MSVQDREEFVRHLSGYQRSLYAFVYTLLPDMTAADDIVQNTNLLLWRKFDAGEEIRHFPALARELARYEVLTFLKKRQRDPLRFDPELVAKLGDEMDADDDEVFDARRAALRVCLGELPEHCRRLVTDRYTDGGSVQNIAEGLGRSAAAVSQSLYRIRNTLAGCIAKRLDSTEEEQR